MLTVRFENAMLLAARLHASQTRKGTAVPYIAHLLAVTSLVLEDGGDEDQAIAALLHDAVEDQGGEKILGLIREQFGDRVARIVEECTDSFAYPKPPWRSRKETYIRHLQSASTDSLRVSLADKLHNARAILQDLRQHGKGIWSRFNGGKEGTLWYYRVLLRTFQDSQFSSFMVEELARVVREIESLAEESG